MRKVLQLSLFLIILSVSSLHGQTFIHGDTARWNGEEIAPSCLLPDLYELSLMVTIPAGMDVTYLYINSNYSGINLNYGKVYFTTDCGRDPGNGYSFCSFPSPGTCLLQTSNNNLITCFSHSCSAQSFILTMHLGRDSGGTGCNTNYIWFDDRITKFYAFVEGTINLCTGIEPLSSDYIHIYPDPVGNELEIQGMSFKKGKLIIYTTFGQILYQSAVTNPQAEIDVSNLSSGIYFLEMQTENGNVVRKFVKE